MVCSCRAEFEGQEYYYHHRGFPKLAVFVNSHLADTEEEPALFSDPDLELVAINHYDHLRQRLQQPQDTTAWTMLDHCHRTVLHLSAGVSTGLETVYKSHPTKNRGRCSARMSHLKYFTLRGKTLPDGQDQL